MLKRVAVLIGSLLAASSSSALSLSDPVRLDLVLKPRAGADRIDYVDVSMTIGSPDAKPGEPLIGIPAHVAGFKIDYNSETFKIIDQKGDIPLVQRDLAGTSTIASREWSVARATVGDVTISYRVPTRSLPKAGVPNLELRAEAMAVSGAGLTFLAIPQQDKIYQTRLRWDLSELPPGSEGVWAYGKGDVEHTGPSTDIANSFFFAGKMRSFEKDSFGFYWASNEKVEDLAARTEKTFELYKGFFRHHPDSYRIFMRTLPSARGSGTAMNQSFIFDYPPPDTKSGKMGQLIAHEMAHTFLSGFSTDSTADAWYSEGAAEYYSHILPLRAGITDSTEFLRGLNETMANYYPRPSRDMSIEAAANDGFFTGNSVQQLAYGRGRLYLAGVNQKIRKKTGGKHSLDDVTLALNALDRAGKPHGESVWLDLVEKYVGSEARADHVAFRAGKLVIPPSDAFGPCFRRERWDVRRFDLGFDENIVRSKSPVIQELKPGSVGAKAGLRNGDELVSPPSLGAIYGDPKATVTFKVRRNGKEFDVTYLPREEAIEAYHWTRNPTVAETACRGV